MPNSDPLRPAAVRSLLKWLTGQSNVGVVKRKGLGVKLDDKTIYLAYVQLDCVKLFQGDEGLWTASGSGPTAEGMTWLEMNSAELDESYTWLARTLFPDLAEIKMHCEVLHWLPDGTKIRRWVSNAGLVMTRSRTLDGADPHFLPDHPQQWEMIWSFTSAQQHFRVIGSDRATGMVLQHAETWPKEDF